MVDEEFVLFAAEITWFLFASRARGIHPDAPQPIGLLCNPGFPHNLDVPLLPPGAPPPSLKSTQRGRPLAEKGGTLWARNIR